MSQRTKARTPILSSAGFLLGLSMLLVSCSTTKVNNDYDPSVDFATLKNYAWLEKANPNEAPTIRDNTLLRNRIERSVDAVLDAKGLNKVPRDEADFLISQHIGIQQKLQVDTTQYGYGYGFGYGAWGGPIGGYPSQTTTVSQYDEGTLMLDFVDPEDNNLIWRGTGQSRVRKTSNPEEREKLIRAVVDKILAQFPPAKK
ncbi:MAG: DUF4136 domain-containing protein [Myxococcota bacterium]|nr:DUF4136 domain-containing protein [Myxococcota bacterium]